MLKLTKTGIGLLTNQYRSVLRKCLLINLGAFLLFQENAFSELYYAVTDNNNNVVTLMRQRPNSWWSGVYDYHDVDNLLAGKADKATTLSGYGITNAYTKTETDSAISQAVSGFVTNNVQSLNYYYTFRVDERVEAIDYTSFFQKDFSTLRFGMPTYAFTSSFV